MRLDGTPAKTDPVATTFIPATRKTGNDREGRCVDVLKEET